MAAETNDDFYRSTLRRMESINRSTTLAPARISRNASGPNTSGLVSQQPPGPSSRADMTAQADISALRNSMIRATRRSTPELAGINRGPNPPGLVFQQPSGMPSRTDMAVQADITALRNSMMRATPHSTAELAGINRGLPGLNDSGFFSRHLDLYRPPQRSADSRLEASEAESFLRLRNQLSEAEASGAYGRRNQGRRNQERDLDNLIDEINTATSGVPNNKAATFLKSLPILSLTDLPDDNQDCPICMENYHTHQHDEPPVRLPCDHIIGKDCLQRWLQSSVLNRNNNTCPMCRTVLYNRDMFALGNPLRDIRGVIDQLPEGSRPRYQTEHARLEEATNRPRSDREQREEWAAPRWQNGTTSALERLEELERSSVALREDFVRMQEITMARVEQLNDLIPASGSAAREHVTVRDRREQINQTHAEITEALARQPRRMRARADRELEAEIALRRDYGRPLRERRGAM